MKYTPKQRKEIYLKAARISEKYLKSGLSVNWTGLCCVIRKLAHLQTTTEVTKYFHELFLMKRPFTPFWWEHDDTSRQLAAYLCAAMCEDKELQAYFKEQEKAK